MSERDKARGFRIQKWFWYANLPVVTYVYFWHRDLFDQVGVFYLIVISIITPAGGAAAGEQAAEANQGSEKTAP